MSESHEDIERQALKLSRSRRAQIALHLLDSLEQEQSSVSRDVIEQAWIEESVRRLEAYRRGEMEAYPAEEVIADLERPAE
jgi:putative addiction module component (TIGR02574 family)